MEYNGTVNGGVVVLENDSELPDGIHVRVIPDENGKIPALAERFGHLIGKAQGLPEDLAENHDHYLHGQPKREAK